MGRKSVFLSYASEDEEARRAFEREMSAGTLQAVSLPTSVDHGQGWQRKAASMLAAADGFVVLIGRGTHSSKPVAWEIAQARMEGLPIVGIRLSPEASMLPQGLRPSELLECNRGEVSARLESRFERTNYLDQLANRIRNHLDPEAIPEGPVDELFRIYAVLAMVKESAVTREDVHNAWSAWMTSINASHQSIVPFSELDDDVAAQDEPYVVAIRSAIAEMKATNGIR